VFEKILLSTIQNVVTIVEDAVILALKSVRRVLKAPEVPLVNYLIATWKDVGWIINCAESKVEIKPRVRALPVS
jgi:hypothetical protein